MKPQVTSRNLLMRIDINKIAPEGLSLAEDIAASTLDLETDIVKFRGPVRIEARVEKITNAVSVNLTLSCAMYAICSRCLNEFKTDFKKNLRLSYPVSKQESTIDTSTSLECHGERSRIIDLDADIREEIILDYPLKPLCNLDCKGLCPKCGKNLNEEKCSCVY